MSQELQSAIGVLDAEIDQLGSPKLGTSLWWLLQAKATGRSLLRVFNQRKIFDPIAADRFRQGVRSKLMSEPSDEANSPNG